MGKKARAATAIIIHELDHARAALAVAAEFDRPVILLSAPGAAGYVGPAWFLEVVAIAAAEAPGAHWDAVLDCADKPGHVLAALRQGAKAVRFTGSKKTAGKLAAIARQSGAHLHTGRLQAFDLHAQGDPEAACRAWLEGARPGVRRKG